MADKAIEVLLDEKRNFPPPKEFQKLAHARSVSVFASAMRDLTDLPCFTMSV
jgi:hypothetical protein